MITSLVSLNNCFTNGTGAHRSTLGDHIFTEEAIGLGVKILPRLELLGRLDRFLEMAKLLSTGKTRMSRSYSHARRRGHPFGRSSSGSSSGSTLAYRTAVQAVMFATSTYSRQ